MAISRREILKRGVSYGSGCINFHNDSVAYDHALRKLAENTALADFRTLLAETEERLAAEAAAEAARLEAEKARRAAAEAAAESCMTEAAEETAAMAVSAAPEAIETASAAPAAADAGDEDPVCAPAPADEAAAAPAEEEPEEPPVNPLADCIAAAGVFCGVCAELALSEMFIKIKAIIETMQQECLPAVEDLDALQADYDSLLDYLAHC